MYMQKVAIYSTTFQSTNRVTILGVILFWNSRTNLQSIYTYKFSLIQNNFDTVHMRHSNSVHQTCTYVTICKQSYTENVWQLLSEQDPIMSPVDPYIQMQVKKQQHDNCNITKAYFISLWSIKNQKSELRGKLHNTVQNFFENYFAGLPEYFAITLPNHNCLEKFFNIINRTIFEQTTCKAFQHSIITLLSYLLKTRYISKLCTK